MYQDCQSLKKTQTETQALSEESVRKKIKRLTGEIDLLESYSQTISLVFTKALKVSKDSNLASDMQKVAKSIGETIFYMRELCDDTGLSVPTSKRVQRQVRYERLRTEFTQMISKIRSATRMGSGSAKSRRKSSTGAGSEPRKMKELESQLENERHDYLQKSKLYKDQIKKMRGNIDLFKENIN